MSSNLLSMISAMEIQLNKMKAELGIKAVKPVKAKKEKDPDAPPAPLSPWIVFTQRVSGTLKAAKTEVGAAPVYMQFASSLKEQNGDYESWTPEAILAAWPLWTKPVKAPSKASSGDESSVTGDKPQKVKKPQSDETKAAAAAKRAATKAAKEGKAAIEVVVKDAEPVVKAAEPAVKAVAKPKAVVKPKASYTMEQLIDFGELEHEGVEFGLNVRGDVIDGEGTYVGQYDGVAKKLVKGKPPADWAAVAKAMA